jgi:hypothetical protein
MMDVYDSPPEAASPEHGLFDNNNKRNNDDEEQQRREFIYPYEKNKEMPWKDVIVPQYIKPFIEEKNKQDSKPTVRGVLYYLESMRVLPKNDPTYTRLKTALSNARRGYKNKVTGIRGKPSIPMDAFADNTRHVIKDFDDEERSLTDYIYDGITHFKKLPDGFQTLVPRWLDQKNYVEVWVEKDSKARDVQKALNGRHVVIAPHRGNPSITFIHENIERVVDQYIQHKREHVYILYLGDLDPVGWNMDKLIKQDLAKQTEDLTDDEGNPAAPRFTFKRIGITIEQIRKHKLTHLMHPDEMTLAKLKLQTKLAASFKRQFGSLFQIELEAFDLIPFTEFQKMIIQEVDRYFSKEIRKQVLNRPEYSQKPSEIKEQIVDALYDLIEELKR